MIKYKHLFLWIGGLTAVVALLSFGKNKSQTLYCSSLQTNIYSFDNQYFVKKMELQNIVHKRYPQIDSMPFREINIALLEESIDNHPSIRKAEVYSTLNGSLKIDVWQHRPIARVMSEKQKEYYLIKDGSKMPLSPNYSASVPLITGQVSDTIVPQLKQFWTELEHNNYFRDFFNGLQIKENGEWVLYPKAGQHQVLLGEPQDVENKLNKLKIFYQKAVNSQNIDSLRSLNLKYEGQVVCTKN